MQLVKKNYSIKDIYTKNSDVDQKISLDKKTYGGDVDILIHVANFENNTVGFTVSNRTDANVAICLGPTDIYENDTLALWKYDASRISGEFGLEPAGQLHDSRSFTQKLDRLEEKTNFAIIKSLSFGPRTYNYVRYVYWSTYFDFDHDRMTVRLGTNAVIRRGIKETLF